MTIIHRTALHQKTSHQKTTDKQVSQTTKINKRMVQILPKYMAVFLLTTVMLVPVVISKSASANAAHDETHNATHNHAKENVDHHTEHNNDNHHDKKVEKHSDHHDGEDSHGDEHGHADEHGHEEGHIEISNAIAKKSGIINSIATNAYIKKSTTVYGRTVIKPTSIRQIKARFSGLITKLNVNVGDNVKAGDILVEVESSDSLRKYTIVSPMSGVVATREANPGEIAKLQTLITLENYEQLWAELRVFPSQKTKVKKGQNVTVFASEKSKHIQSKILHLLANKNQPFITAIVAIDNKEGVFSPGQMLTGRIVTSEEPVRIAIDNRALQEIEGKDVVFVTNEGGYEKRELQLGQTDGEFTEVLVGLDSGEHYAVINSYLLKADLGKAGAAHVH